MEEGGGTGWGGVEGGGENADNCNWIKIKKTQEDMKVTLSEIKKNIHETNNWRDEAGIQIYSLEHKE